MLDRLGRSSITEGSFMARIAAILAACGKTLASIEESGR
jgi:hypothetical protein